MPIDAEFSGGLRGIDNQPSGYASEVTLSGTTNGPFGQPAIDLAIHTMLNRFQAIKTGPGGATIGISSFTFIDGNGVRKTVSNGDSSKWPVFAYLKNVTNFTVSIGFYRCDMIGSWTVQHWS